MKIVLDLDHLLQNGEITLEEHRKFSQFAAHETGSMAFNMLTGFSVIAIFLGALALVPTPQSAIVLGAFLLIASISMPFLRGASANGWSAVTNVGTILGALMFGGGLIIHMQGHLYAFIAIAVAFTLAGIFARSGLLIALACFAVASAIGARTGYWHASYSLAVTKPTLTICVFSALAWCTYQISLRVKAAYSRLAIITARVSVFFVNFGFWIGSLWGDKINLGMETQVLNRNLFSLLWAAALIACAIWAYRMNRRWLVNVCAVFGAIHFYTQWFERLGAQPASVLLAGILALALTFALKHWNAQQHGKA